MTDLRYGLRLALRRPGFTVVAVLTLALGIGANTAIFSVISSVVLQPLPWKEPERLVRIWESNLSRGWPQFSVSLPNLIDWRERNRTLETIAAWQSRGFNLTGTDEPERIDGAAVTPDLFPMLGAEPAPGRGFLPEEAGPGGGERVAIITHGLWKRRFGVDPAVVGKTVVLNDTPHVIVGVLPESFAWIPGFDVFVPLDLTSDVRRANHVLAVFGALKPGVTAAQARADLEGIARQLEAEHPGTNTGWGVALETFQDWIVNEDFRRALWVLAGAVGLVLLVACSNVANLLLAQSADRRREISIRAALGASRIRIARQLLTEGVFASLLGGAVGLLLASWGVDLMISMGTDSVPRADEIGLDARAIAFTFGLSLLTTLLFGLAPVLQLSRGDFNEDLKEGGRGTDGKRRVRLRGVLVASEVALSVVLLVGAGLLVRSFWRLQAVEPGFRTDNLLTLQITLPGSRYRTISESSTFYRQLIERLGAVPGIEASAAASTLPFGDGNTAAEVVIEGRAPDADGAAPSADWRMVSPSYFSTMGIPLLQGRPFTDAEAEGTPPVLLVSETMARRYWPDQDAIGRRVRSAGPGSAWFTIVGIVGDVRNLGLDADLRPVMYMPAWQNNWNPMSLVVRTTGEPGPQVAAVKAVISGLDRDLPVSEVATMEEMIRRSVGPRRFNMTLMAIFAAVALMLAGVGIYGVTSWSVTQRTREIGIRMALGAQRLDVLAMVVRQGSRPLLSGVIIGLAAAWALSRVMTGLVFGVTAQDPVTFLAIPLLLGLVALAASYLPARRATLTDPWVALRQK